MIDVEDLRAHLAERHGFRARTVFAFEDDVMLLREDAGRAWAARSFGPSRPRERVEGDARILAWLADRDYPAERPALPDPVSTLDGHTVLVTDAVRAVPRVRRRQTIKDAGGIRGLGELLATLHGLELEAPADRPGGASHHLADGPPAAEVERAREWLAQVRERAGVRELSHLDVIEDALAAIDTGEGLPEALVHPDFVLANVVASATPEPRMVLVDWTGAGRGPRLWSLAFLLWAEGAKDLRRVDLALEGYRRHLDLRADELARLEAMIAARPLVLTLWRLHHGALAAVEAVEAVRGQRRLAGEIAARVRMDIGA